MPTGLVVVADTSPLNYLVRVGKPGVLGDLYGQILVPMAVADELRHAGSPVEVRSWIADPPTWLRVVPVRQVDLSLPAKLGRGEREAISLAVEKRADALIIDDAAGRAAAEERHIPVNGTLFILLEAALRGHLDLEATLHRLRLLDFRFSHALEEEMLMRYKRNRQ